MSNLLSEKSVIMAIAEIKNNLEKQDETKSKGYRRLCKQINDLLYSLKEVKLYDTIKYRQELEQMCNSINNFLQKIKDRSVYIKYCHILRKYYVGQTHDNTHRQHNHKYKELKITETLVENLDSEEANEIETYFMNCPPFHIEDYECVNYQKLHINDYYLVGYKLAKKISESNPDLKICYYKRVPFDGDYQLKYDELKQKYDKLIETLKGLV